MHRQAQRKPVLRQPQPATGALCESYQRRPGFGLIGHQQAGRDGQHHAVERPLRPVVPAQAEEFIKAALGRFRTRLRVAQAGAVELDRHTLVEEMPGQPRRGSSRRCIGAQRAGDAGLIQTQRRAAVVEHQHPRHVIALLAAGNMAFDQLDRLTERAAQRFGPHARHHDAGTRLRLGSGRQVQHEAQHQQQQQDQRAQRDQDQVVGQWHVVSCEPSGRR